MSISTRLRTALLTTFAVAALLLVWSGCGGASHAIGDCVTVELQLTDHKLEDADCASADPTDYMNPVYSIDEVVDDVDGGCQFPDDYNEHVTFTDEPEGVVYCLSAVE